MEHSRVVCFGAGHGLPSDQAKVFISSADWMPRNFDRRVEILVPIRDDRSRLQLISEIMAKNLLDTEQSWELSEDGEYKLMRGVQDQAFNAHTFLMERSNSSKPSGE